MKVLFLDIDGVCNCSSTRQRHGIFIGIDPDMAARVKRIVEQTNCTIILSSTWRLSADSRAEVKRHIEFADVTPSLPGGFRGDEVADWLSKHPEVTRHAILDDDSDFHPDQPLFKTSWSFGITDEIADQVIGHLNAEVMA